MPKIDNKDHNDDQNDDAMDELVTQLYNEYAPKVEAQAKKALKYQEDIDDVVQETFLRIWKYKHVLPEIRSMGAWVNSITNSVVCDKIKHRSKTNHASLDEMIDNEENNYTFVSKDIGPDVEAQNSQFLEHLDEALENIKNKQYREVWRLRHLEKYTTREIAEKMNKKPEIIRRWNRQTTKELRELLEKKGYSPDF